MNFYLVWGGKILHGSSHLPNDYGIYLILCLLGNGGDVLLLFFFVFVF